MFNKKYKDEIEALKQIIQNKDARIVTLGVELKQKREELEKANAAVIESLGNFSILESQNRRQRKALTEICAHVGDNHPTIVEAIGFCDPDLVAYNNLPVMTVRIIAQKVTIRPNRMFNNFCSTFSTQLENELSDIFKNPTVDTTAIEHGSIINLTSKYVGKFQDSCSSLQRFLETTGLLFGVKTNKMDPVERKVEYIYHQPFRGI